MTPFLSPLPSLYVTVGLSVRQIMRGCIAVCYCGIVVCGYHCEYCMILSVGVWCVDVCVRVFCVAGVFSAWLESAWRGAWCVAPRGG